MKVVEKAIPFSTELLLTSVKKKKKKSVVDIYVGLFLVLGPLIYMPIFSPIQHCLDCCRFIVQNRLLRLIFPCLKTLEMELIEAFLHNVCLFNYSVAGFLM